MEDRRAGGSWRGRLQSRKKMWLRKMTIMRTLKETDILIQIINTDID